MIIAGSDSIAGAGVQRDIRTCHEIGAVFTNVITCITAQNSIGVQAILDTPKEMIKSQISSIKEDFNISYIKTGMLHSIEIIDIVDELTNEFLGAKKLILDPVMIATSGGRLLKNEAIEKIKTLITKALIITPNLPEAEVLTDIKISTIEDIRLACQKMHSIGAKNVLLKGGHFDIEGELIINTLFDGKNFYEFTSKRIKNKEFHGSGCMLASAISAYLYKNKGEMFKSIQEACSFVDKSLLSYF
jgi:hydroxymethylpyrimidine/phosphomethylpyrimidine kinase